MTPKEKAQELIDKFNDVEDLKGRKIIYFIIDARQCALIAVDECIESTKQLIHHYVKENDDRYSDIYLSMSLSIAYWQEVKKYISYEG